MTFANMTDLVEGGNGELEYRLRIEGFDYDFCTSQTMANNSTYPKRLNGFLRAGLTFQQGIELPKPILSMNTNNITIVDYQEQATMAFYRKPTYSAYLNENIDTTETEWSISNTTGLSIGDHLWVGGEVIKVLAISPGSTNIIWVQRGMLSTTPSSHFTITTNGTTVRPIIENTPFTIERRRAKIFAYGKGDDLQGEGTLIWRGVVKTDPSFRGDSYQIQINGINDILKSSIGVDGDDLKLRGLNFGNYQWMIVCQLLKTDVTGFESILATTAPIDLTALLGSSAPYFYFESVQEFAANATSQINLGIAASSQWSANDPGGLYGGCAVTTEGELVFTSTTTLLTNYTIMYSTYISPTQNSTTRGFDYFEMIANKDYYNFTDGTVGDKISGGKAQLGIVYCQPLRNRVAPFPSQMMYYTSKTTPASLYYTNYSSYVREGNKFHLANYGLTNLVDTLMIYKDDTKIATTNVTSQIILDESENTLVTDLFIPDTSRNVFQIQIIENDHKIVVGTAYRNYADGSNYYNVVGFLRHLIDKSPEYVNTGLAPLITSDDIDIEDMQRVFNTISTKSIQNNRVFSFYRRIDSLEEYLAEEFKLIGVFPALTRDGKLTIRKLKNINTVETPDYTLDSGDILTDKSYISIESNKFGIWNSVAISTGYNALADKWEGAPIVQNNIDSLSHFKANQITIKPKSELQQTTKTFSQTEIMDYADVVLRSTSPYAEKYGVATIEVPMKYFYINIGATIQFKSKQLPNYVPNFSWLTSRRGGTFSGIVVSKNFDLSTGFGTITVMVNDAEYSSTNINNKAILAPDALTTLVTAQGGNIFKVTLDAATSALYMDKTDTQEDLWFVGDGVRFDKFNSSTQVKGSGKIVAISGSANALVMTVDCNGAGSAPSGFATPGTSFYMRPSDSNSPLTSARQLQYAFYDTGTVAVDNTNYPGINNKLLAF